MKIYEMRVAPNPRRVRMYLHEKNIQMEYVELDLQSGDNLSRSFREKNPMAKVPVLELDDGTFISETMSICRYFEATYPDNPLLGSSPLEIAQIDMWQRRMEWYFLLPTGFCFQHGSDYFADRMTPIKEWGEECRKSTQKFFSFLDKHLSTTEFIAGDAFSVADITALCTIDFNKINQLAISQEQVHLQRWYDQVSARSSAKA